MQINDGSKPRQDFSEFLNEVIDEHATKQNMTTQKEIDSITEHFEHELKEAAHWHGGWDKLREVIAQLEENENEAAGERAMNEPGAWEGGFADNH